MAPTPRSWSSGQSLLNLIQRLPPPIAVAWHKMENEPPGALRKDMAIACVEACLRTLVAILLSDYLGTLRSRDATVEATLPQLEKSQLGSLVQLARALIKALGNGPDVFLGDANGWWYDAKGEQTRIARALETFSEERNRMTHGVPTAAAVEAFLGRNEEGLDSLLRSLAWLQKYRLFHQKTLQSHDHLYVGHLQFLSGPSELERSEPAQWAPRLTTGWVYAVHPSGTPLLALYPWMQVSEDRVWLFKSAPGLRTLELVNERDGQPRDTAPKIARREVSVRDWLAHAAEIPQARLDNSDAREQLAHREFFDELPIGSEIAGYRVTGVLGRGAWGVVYEVESPVSGRAHALKLLLPWRAGNPRYAQRHQREGSRLASFRDAHVVPVEELVHLPNGTIGLRMPVYRRGTLRAQVRSGGLPPGEILRFARDMASGLAALHGRELIHRDVKPDNFLVSDDGRALLADLGHALHDDDEHLSSSGAIAGTPDYWSPEQERRGPLTVRSDVYSLALTIEELATGRSAREVRADGPGSGVSGELAGLLRRMGERIPRERPSAAEVVEEIDRLVREAEAEKREAEAEKREAERAEPERAAAERAEAERAAAERAEAERAAERAAAERAEAARREAERAEAARREAERAEAERAEAERAEAERAEAERAEARREAERYTAEEAAKREAEQREAQRRKAAEAVRAEAQKRAAEVARREAERREAERYAADEAAKREAEQREAQRREAAEAVRAEAERREAEKRAAEAARREAEKREADKRAAEAARREEERRLAAEEAARREAAEREAKRLAAEQAVKREAEKREAEKREAEKREAEKREADKRAAEAAWREEERRLTAEEAVKRDAAERETQRLAAQEAARRRTAELEAQGKAASEAEARKVAEEQARRKEAAAATMRNAEVQARPKEATTRKPEVHPAPRVKEPDAAVPAKVDPEKTKEESGCLTTLGCLVLLALPIVGLCMCTNQFLEGLEAPTAPEASVPVDPQTDTPAPAPETPSPTAPAPDPAPAPTRPVTAERPGRSLRTTTIPSTPGAPEPAPEPVPSEADADVTAGIDAGDEAEMRPWTFCDVRYRPPDRPTTMVFRHCDGYAPNQTWVCEVAQTPNRPTLTVSSCDLTQE